MGTKLHSGKEKTGRLLRKASCALLAVLLVVAFVPVGVLSAFAKEVNAGGDQNKESSHDSVFANVGISPLASSATIVLKAQESGSLTIRNKWSSTIIISQSGYSDTEVKASQELSRNVAANEEISVKESSAGKTFRAWREDTYAFVRGAACAITSMPAMSAFTTDASGNRTGDLFFENFNAYGSITSLPKGSFNTSNITSVGKSFFIGFNYYGGLKELPQGSFNTSNIATIGDGFFYGFNYSGGLTSLPQGSFGINKITSAGSSFFREFNSSGSLTSLPAGSFNTSNIVTVGNDFFLGFNYSGSLKSLPKGSFNTSKITGVHLGAFIGYNFFYSFNESGSLTALPEESFDTSSMVDVGDNFFKNFDANGNITALPGSFQLPSQPQSVSSSYCNYMFYNSALSKGNQLVTLNFRSSAADVFTNTDISPISPATDTVVYVNGTSKSLTKYVITFNPQGGTVSPTSITFQENSSFGTLPTPARSGYIFDSWNSKPDGTGTTYYASTSISANVTAYAIWRQPSSAKEIFSFSLAGVAATISGTSISVTVPYGTSITSATPNISYSVKATITPQGAQNFTSPVKYIVKAEDGSTKTYAVTVKVAGKTVTPTNPDPTPTNPTTPTPGSDKPITNTKVKVTKVSLATAPPIYMVKGRALTLKASVQPYNATNKKLTYKSLSPKIVKVDKNSGKMKALKTGKARIIVTSQDGKKRAACTIIVVAKTLKVKALKSFSPLTLTVGKTKQIKTKVTPVKATGVMPAYSSSNKQVATIDKAGVITAHKKGTTAITVKAGGKTKTFKVAVR